MTWNTPISLSGGSTSRRISVDGEHSHTHKTGVQAMVESILAATDAGKSAWGKPMDAPSSKKTPSSRGAGTASGQSDDVW